MENVPCILCHTFNIEHVITTKSYVHPIRTGENFSICRCLSCGLLYTNPRPTESEILSFYKDYNPHRIPSVDNLSRINSSFKNSESRQTWFDRLIDSHTTTLPDLPKGSKVLEFGCATGIFLKSLEVRGWELKGVEPVQQAADYARRFLHLDVITGSIESAGFGGETFDLVYGWNVIEHFARPDRTLTEIHRILKPNGFLCISMPNAGCWERHLFGKYWTAYDVPYHYYHYTPNTIEKLLNKTGFSVIALYHQRNIANIIQSIGAILKNESLLNLGASSPSIQRMVTYSTFPLAFGLAAIRQGGQMSVIAQCSK